MAQQLRSLHKSDEPISVCATDSDLLLAAIPDTLIVLRQDGTIVRHERGAVRNRLIDSAVATTPSLLELVSPQRQAVWEQALAHAHEGGLIEFEEREFTVGVASCEVRLFRCSDHEIAALVRNLDVDVATFMQEQGPASNGEDNDYQRALLLSRAIADDQLELVLQPKLNLVPRYIDSVEALLRWPQTDSEDWLPERILPLAEAHGLSKALDDWVLNAACRIVAQWQSTPLADLRIAINLSARQFRDPRLSGKIMRALTRHRLMPDSLELEFREQDLLNALPSTLDGLVRLHESGVFISVDDFGTGASSVAQLRNLPLNSIKIDQSLVSATREPGSDMHSLCAAMIALAHSLGLNVTAEGVETEEQLRYLHFLDCDQVQGFHVARPMSFDVLTTFVSEHRARYPRRHPLS
ncbi:MAG: EAL domain-containing protein [Pseudomonadota bacterium]